MQSYFAHCFPRLDLSYSKNVKPTHQFLQINLLGLVDEASGTAKYRNVLEHAG